MPGMKMQPDSKATRVLEMLRAESLTTIEIAAELEVKTRVASAHLANLRRKGRITSAPSSRPTGGRRGNVWMICEVQP